MRRARAGRRRAHARARRGHRPAAADPGARRASRFAASILLGHLHWDHTHGLPFFRAGDHPDARVDLYMPAQGDPVAVLARVLSPPHFPITPTELRGDWRFHALEPGDHAIEGLSRSSRARSRTRAVARSATACPTDGPPSPICPTTARSPSAPAPRVSASTTTTRSQLAHDVDVLVHDAQYTAAEMPKRADFGHSAIDYAVGLAERAGAGRCLLFHHDPPRTDDEIDEMVRAYAAARPRHRCRSRRHGDRSLAGPGAAGCGVSTMTRPSGSFDGRTMRGRRRKGWAIAPTLLVLALVAAACAGNDDGTEGASVEKVGRCDWPMWGQSSSRTFAYPCETGISPTTASKLKLRWFFNAGDVVTATPAVIGDSVYVGDWAGTFYALRAPTAPCAGSTPRRCIPPPTRARSCRRPRSPTWRASRPSTSVGARRCTHCERETASCAGSTSSDGRATATTRRRSSRHPLSSTAW